MGSYAGRIVHEGRTAAYLTGIPGNSPGFPENSQIQHLQSEYSYKKSCLLRYFNIKRTVHKAVD